MHSTETLPIPDAPNIETPLGGVALYGEVAFDDAYVQEGVNQLEAEANRIHDVGAAYDAAVVENEIFDVYDEAVLQNEVFDAHTEAIKEQEARAAAEMQMRIDEQAKKPASDEAVDEQEGPSAIDLRGQAEAALREEGITTPLPVGSQVQKDAATGNLMIIGKNDVKILEPQGGGRTKIVDYSFDAGSGVVTISAKGMNTLLTREGEYIEEDRRNGKKPTASALNLPPAVAAMAGFIRAVPVQ